MIDTHTHLNFEAFADDWQQVVDRALKAGVTKMIVVGGDLKSSQQAFKMAEGNEALYASVGVHPHHARGMTDSRFTIQDLRRRLEKLARHPKVVAIGEVGLDYHAYAKSKYQMTNDKKGWTRIINLQKRLLGLQVEIAKKFDKPMIIHSREARGEVLDTLEHFSKSDGKLPKAVFHCFDGSKSYAKTIFEAGLYISFTGNLTYDSGRAEVAKDVPLNRLLLETDCPYMMPQGERIPGFVRQSRDRNRKRSEPKDVKVIAEFHGKQRGLSLEEVEEATDANVRNLFGL